MRSLGMGSLDTEPHGTGACSMEPLDTEPRDTGAHNIEPLDTEPRGTEAIGTLFLALFLSLLQVTGKPPGIALRVT